MTILDQLLNDIAFDEVVSFRWTPVGLDVRCERTHSGVRKVIRHVVSNHLAESDVGERIVAETILENARKIRVTKLAEQCDSAPAQSPAPPPAD